MEAKYVEELAKNFKVNCKVLNWNKSKKSNALMENARDERYNRIINFCKEEQIITLMTAHHFDDCLETYLMRKKRKVYYTWFNRYTNDKFSKKSSNS